MATPETSGRSYLLIVAAVGLGILAMIALSVRVMLRRSPRPAASASAPAKPPDQCVVCHKTAADDPGDSHAALQIGCASCHLGNAKATAKAAAHKGMEPEPGALSTVDRTCGKCHTREAATVKTSLMAAARGVVAVDRWAFGEQQTPNGEQTMEEALAMKNPTPAEDHLRRLCGGCHIGSRRDNRDDAVRGIGTGCSSCHVATHSPDNPHPKILKNVPDRQCLGCHSRSARISLSYQGLAEVSGPYAESCKHPAKLFDGRSACRFDEDVHHAAGIGCTDCHLHTELMGDGVVRKHEAEQVEIACDTCHGPKEDAHWSKVKDPISKDLLRIHKQKRAPDEKVRLGRRGTPVWNLRPGAKGWQLFPKSGGRPWNVKQTPRDENHQLRGHERLTCTSCHAAWMPSCPSCHTRFDPGGKQWDFGRAEVAPGKWIEENQGTGYGVPGLAVRADGRIAPAAPGMIAELDARAAGGALRNVGLFSSYDPHTTGKQARGCASCHDSARALGLGTGELDLGAAGPRFRPAHPDPREPGLAVDGWTQLFPHAPARGTRVGARGLGAGEQHRILAVGACLPCHAKAADQIWRDFPRSIARLAAGGTACTGHAWRWLKRHVPARRPN